MPEVCLFGDYSHREGNGFVEISFRWALEVWSV